MKSEALRAISALAICVGGVTVHELSQQKTTNLDRKWNDIAEHAHGLLPERT